MLFVNVCRPVIVRVPHRRAMPLNASNIVRRDFRKVIKLVRVSRIRFHDLRHYHATLLLRHGVNLKVVQSAWTQYGRPNAPSVQPCVTRDARTIRSAYR